MKYLARIREEDKSEQLLIDHLTQTAEMSERFAKEFDNPIWSFMWTSPRFRKIFRCFSKTIKWRKKCDHSTAGAKVIFNSGPF